MASAADVPVAGFRITKGARGTGGIRRTETYARAAGLKVTAHQTCDDAVQLVDAYLRDQYEPADGVEVPPSSLLRWTPFKKDELVKEAS